MLHEVLNAKSINANKPFHLRTEWSNCVIFISVISQKPQDEDINPLDIAIITAKSLT